MTYTTDGGRMMNSNVCVHGSLKRQCQICDQIAEIEELKEQLAEAQRQNESLQAAFLKVRVALGLDLHSNDNLLDAIAEAKKDAALWKALCKQLWVACPTTLECRAFHHAKQDQHRMTETCRPQEEYLAAIDAVNQAMREGASFKEQTK